MSLQKKCNEIKKQIKEIKGSNKNILPISDGIVNIDNYLESKYKILWILKESNDVIDGTGGDWCLTEELNQLKNWAEQPKGGKITFQRMIYSSFGILNNFILWENMPNIFHLNVFETIKKIAYINVKKIPGGNVANEKLISQAYIENKELLLKQIKVYNPDIIIAGNTLHYFFNDLPIPFDDKISNGKTAYYPSSDKLYINAYHPAVRENTIKEKDYCNDIIIAVKDWVDNWKK